MKEHDSHLKIIFIAKIVFVVYVAMIFILALVGFGSKKIDLSFESENIMEWTDDWDIYVDRDELGIYRIPVDLDGVTTQTVTIRNTLPRIMGDYNCLLVESKRQDTMVYVNNGLRKKSTSASLRWGRSLPYIYIFVPLDTNDEGGTVTITYQTDSVYGGDVGAVYLGDEISILMMLLRKNVIWLLLITVLFALGLLNFAFWIIYRRAFDRSSLYAYSGAFCVFTAVYCFNLLRIKQCFVKDLPMLEVFGFSAFMLIPFSILMIAYGVSSYKYQRLIGVLSLVALLNFIAQQVLHNALDMDYFTMQSGTQLLVMTVLVILIVVYQKDEDKGIIYDNEYVVASCAGLLFGIIVEAVHVMIGTGFPTGSVYLICSLAFALIILAYCFISLRKEQEGKKKAEIANQAKSAFLASMSHEIRTPINAIMGINEIISRETKEESTRKYSANVAEASNNLLHLVNDILDYSKIEAGKFDIVEVEYDTKNHIDEVIMLVEARLQEKNLEFKADIDQNLPGTLFGDVSRIKQVLINLLTNAIKYTPKGGFTLTIKCLEINDDEVEIYTSVKDTGIGIRPEDKGKIMNSTFVRVDERKNYNIEGTGLGLAISSQILKLMGTELEIDSEYGQGSDFHFVSRQKIIDRTPIRDKEQKKSEDLKIISTTYPDANVLVVDDTKANLIVMKGLLKQFGIKPTVCESGEKCIELCRNNKYDIIFLDIMMPVFDGVETLSKLKEENLIDDVPVVALTANAISGAKEMYLSQGFDEYMSKPFKMQELESMLSKRLG